MKILVACEESQAVTIELRRLGHDAYSCDIEPCSGGHPELHLQQDVIPLLDEPWDMIIAFPPCTDLCVSGARWFAEKRADGRQEASIAFFMRFANCGCPRVAIENPVGIMSSRFRKPDQIIQPWQFGHGESKATCLWLKGLPLLMPTEIVTPEWDVKADGTTYLSKSGKRDNPTHYLTGYPHELTGAQKAQWERIHRMPPGPDRAKMRSKTYPGIARAMAEQWAGWDAPTGAESEEHHAD